MSVIPRYSFNSATDRFCVAHSWFKLLPGSGQYSKYFRIWTVSEDMILVSRTDQSPNLYNITGTLQTNANEYFMYLWEDMKVTKVDYDLDSARVLTSKPVTIGEQTLDNSGSTQDQTTSFAVEQEVKKTSSFEYSTGFTVNVGMSFSASVDPRIPYVHLCALIWAHKRT